MQPSSATSPQALADRDAILHAVAFAAERFLRSADLDEAVDDVLARLGRATRVDRVYVFEEHAVEGAGRAMSQRFEWTADGVAPQLDNPELQEVPYRETPFARWIDVLSENGLIYGRVEDFPEGERELLTSQNIRSLVAVPIFTRERWWGFVGFDDCGLGRPWTVPEVEALRVAAGTLGAAIQRRQHEEELIEARDRAEEASRLKSVFLANMSHELRTPLNGILGFGQLLAVDAEGESLEYAELIVESGTRLLATLNDLVELSRLESGNAPLRLRPVSPELCVTRAVEEARPYAEAMGLTLRFEMAGDVPARATLDDDAVADVAARLIGNAIKFTERGGVDVTLSVEADGALALRVADTGPGVPDAVRRHVFDAFRQASEGTARSHEGSGLGLAIALRRMERMGGTLAIEATSPQGSVFSARFPAPRPIAGAPAPDGPAGRRD